MTAAAATRRDRARLVLLGCAGLLAGCAAGGGGEAAPRAGRPDGRVEFEAVRAAYLGSAGGGGGTLHFRGRRHRFTVASGGIGGIGAAVVTAAGDVYNLRDLRDFPGAYVQARTGVTLGSGSGELWLRNPAGVVMHLRARREGLMLNLGADAVVIAME